ncbi:MAG: hypothetical protein A2Z88_02520 [Omnitrophica WOR_2 bacterium GWA2_47_8]|nr:MAG: hypothetical protein A2Z88_02520 [Omnitrophica WOR_2 bacterium GWA2_47_8]
MISVKRILFALLVWALTIASSWGCKCDPLEGKAAFKEADVVFTGQVVSVIEYEDEDMLDVQFKVTEVHKGEVDDILTIRTADFKKKCGYNFVMSKRYLVHAKVSKGRLFTGVCSGNMDLD